MIISYVAYWLVLTWHGALANSYHGCVKSLNLSQFENIKRAYAIYFSLHTQPEQEICDTLKQMSLENAERNMTAGWLPHSDNATYKKLLSDLKLDSLPAFVIFSIKNHGRHSHADIHHKYTHDDLDMERIRMDLLTHNIPNVKKLTEVGLDAAIKPRSSFRPLIVLFYAFWCDHITSYLSTFIQSTDDFHSLNSSLLFSILDLHSHDVLPVLQGYNPTRFPFILYYHPIMRKNRVDRVIRYELPQVLPTPHNLLEVFSKLQIQLNTTSGEKLVYDICGSAENQYSQINEGPFGVVCYMTSSNMTDNTPAVIEPWPKPIKPAKPVQKPPVNIFSKKPLELSHLQSRLNTSDSGLYSLTRMSWSDLIEKSHTHITPFITPDLEHTSIVVFTSTECDFCFKSKPVFDSVQQKILKSLEEVSIYEVNCLIEYKLCEEQKISGYPTLIAYRHIDWLQHQTCLSEKTSKLLKYSRHDYHGLIRDEDIVEWIVWLTAPVIKIRESTENIINTHQTNQHKQKSDAELVALLVPKGSYLLPTKQKSKSRGPRLTYECYRLACHRLFGFVDCSAEYHTKLTQSDKDRYKLTDMVVTQIELLRVDGMKGLVMQSLRPFYKLMEAESDSNIHKLHPPHRYHISSKQTCEDNLSQCVDHIVEYSIDHARLTISTLSTHTFHSHQGLIGDKNLPVLVLLVNQKNVTSRDPVYEVLNSVAVEHYTDLRVMTVDVHQYSHWTNRIVPKHFKTQYHIIDENAFSQLYPRLAIISWSDHHHAAFYPNGVEFKQSGHFNYTEHGVDEFIRSYLTNPNKLIEETENF